MFFFSQVKNGTLQELTLPQMTDLARQKLSTYDSAEFQIFTGLVNDLQAGEIFDASTLILVLHFIPDDRTKLFLLKQIASRLKKDAPFFLLDIFGEGAAFNFNMKLLENALMLEGLNATVVDRLMVHIRHNLFVCKEDRITELLEEAGFTDICKVSQTYNYLAWSAIKHY